MIFRSPGFRAKFLFVTRDARRSTPMMAAARSTRSCLAILFLLVLAGLPSRAGSATLEDSAVQFARKIAAALPARETVSCEFRNVSSLQPGEVARVEQAIEAGLQEQGISLKTNPGAIAVLVTLSENFENLVWTAEIRQGDAPHVVLMPVERSSENRAFPVLAARPG